MRIARAWAARALAAVLLLGGAARADRVVDRDGAILFGTAQWRPGDPAVGVGTKRIPIDRVNLIERDDGTLVFAPDFEARVRGYEYVGAEHLRHAYLKLARDAIGVGNHVLARRLLERAEEAGFSGPEALSLKDRIEQAAEKQHGERAVVSARLENEAAVLDGHVAEVFVARAAKSLEEKDAAARLLREAFRRHPRSASAAELLARIAPKDFPVGDARVWLDWHLDLLAAGATMVPSDDPGLARARGLWRKDLHAIRADPILLVTPVKESLVVGRCLAFGRLGCSVLAELFKTETPARTPGQPMSILLFGTREEYKTNTGTGRPVEDPASLEWTAGHYSPSERLSRFFWFSDPDAERRIVGTCVHELTHHWLEEQNPRVRSPSRIPDLRAYWIVEGFATFMEEGIYDVETGTWDLFNPRARSLDVLQAMHGKASLIGWKSLYAIDAGGFHELATDDPRTVALRWELYAQLIPSRRLFYEQAGATCHYLYHADGGKRRQALLDYVVDWYSGRADRLAIETAFGMTAIELGRCVEIFARAVAGGWAPG